MLLPFPHRLFGTSRIEREKIGRIKNWLPELSGYWSFVADLKYNVGVVPSAFLNMEINALGVL